MQRYVAIALFCAVAATSSATAQIAFCGGAAIPPDDFLVHDGRSGTTVMRFDLRSRQRSHARTGLGVAMTSEGFEKLLEAFSVDREKAGEQYELMRLKLVRYFELRMCTSPDHLADEAIDRVARRLAEGERIASPEVMRYVYGVARNVLLETKRTESREQRRGDALADVAMPSLRLEEIEAEKQEECRRACLSRMADRERELLQQYYGDGGQARIGRRQQLADGLGIPSNALRIRIHRMKNQLQVCVEKCMRSDS